MEMYSLEETLIYMQTKNPKKYSNRKACLNDLFCKTDNDYIWINGTLVDKEFLFYLDDNNTNLKKATAMKSIHEMIKGKEFIDDSKDIQWDVPVYFSNLYNYPRNINKDWYDGILETVFYLSKKDVKWKN